jgi:transcriptional regulator with AAA-type ATPase domain
MIETRITTPAAGPANGERRTVETGTLLDGRYRLEHALGRGGMGEVWAARQIALDVRVAIKVPLHPFAPEAMARFRAEARATAELRSQNIVQVHDYGVDGGIAYIAMELLDGETLRDRLAHRRRLSLEETSILAKQAARGLRAAHEKSIVHRDIKPSNLFLAVLDGEKVLKILDFGIAEMQVDRAPGDIRLAKPIIGSPNYLSPEQVRGETIDLRTDLWSLAAVLFRALTGVEPFRAGSSADTLAKILDGPPPRARAFEPALPPAIDVFFARALARDPRHRFASAHELSVELEQIAGRYGPHAVNHAELVGDCSDAVPPSSHGRENTVQLENDAGSALPGAVIRIGNGSSQPREFTLTAGVCRVGARRGADIVVADETVSRAHVEFSLTREGVAVRDLGSRNGTFYLGQRIESAVLNLGSRITVGRTEIAINPEGGALGPSTSSAPSAQTQYGRLRGVSVAMRRLFAVLSRLEVSLVNVLIEGESGTGKEVVARAIHEHSTVSRGPFVAVNCGALERALVRSELFGHRRGAFTSAIEGRLGAFELASGGTLFLDEIGELPLDVQPVLLRALESETVVRVGETIERPVKVRLIAATNRDLEMDVRERRFREDLYYRLMVVNLRIPPLRERIEDVVALAEDFAKELQLGELSPQLLSQLCARRWPGNVRELKNTLKAYSAVGALPSRTACEGESLESALRSAIDVTKPYAERKQEVVETFRRVYVERLLEYTSGNQSEAARLSGLERSYLNKVVHAIGSRK